MALEPQIKEIEVKTNKKLDDLKIGVPVTLNTNGEKIEKVLTIKSFVKIEKTMVSQGAVQIEGVVNSLALIKLENGDFVEIKKVTNFSQNYVNSKIDLSSQVLVKSKVLGTENLSVNEISLMFVQEINLSIFDCEKQMVKYVEDLNKANQKIGTINYQTINNYSVENFEIQNEIDLPTSISKILTCENDVSIKEAVATKDILTVSGEIFTNLIYLTNDETTKLKEQNYVSEFHQELLINGMSEDDVLDVCLNMTSHDHNVVGEMNSKGVLEQNCKVEALVISRRNAQISCLLDAFCPRKELNLEYQSFQSENLLFKKTFCEKVDGSYVMSGDAQISQIVFSSKGEAKVLEVKKDKDGIVAKGEAGIFVVVRLDDEQNSLQSVNITIPFSSTFSCDENFVDEKIFVDAKIKSIEARIKRTKEIDALVDLCFDVVALNEENEVVVGNVVLGEDRKQDLCSMGIYVVDDIKDCWEASKKLLVNPETLMEQNKDLVFPITKPTHIVVYRQKVVEN